MATEGLNKSTSLPPYPQMILEALDAMKQPEGANKSFISKYMESKYGEMPAGHMDLLSLHLTRMTDSGELQFLKNNYVRAGLDAPPKRGRGRPPKPKDPLAAGTIPAAPRPRGRPRKDPNAPPAPKKQKPASGPPPISKTGRPRGRPRKVNVQAMTDGVEA
ncbi:HMG-Y-related protein A-like [Andrographis paniculata]|uniref:HMG-Y-related protein A-like n=1 Tax=Andrographis paniculata TaxID=175694 RepID=UPI0021E7219D|nr:HMG-Y-related protein A-like [Andrographis paniculata]